MTAPPPLYHEQQRRLCCGVHTLNNLFQSPWLNHKQMDDIANRLAKENEGQQQQPQPWWIKTASAYRSLLPGLGNYDILVLVEALKLQKVHLSQHLLDNAQLEKDLADLGTLLLTAEGQRKVKGIIINRDSRNLVMKWLLDGRHWLALIPVPAPAPVPPPPSSSSSSSSSSHTYTEEIQWYDVDSKLPAPLLLGGIPKLLAFIRQNIKEEGGQAFVVSVDED